MQASTLRLLEAAHFTSPQALALAEAIETEVNAAQVVTVPILESKVHEIGARFDRMDLRVAQMETHLAEMETRILHKVTTLGFTGAGLMLTGTGLIITSVFFIVLHFKN
jgi:hypothetical protein